MDWAKRRQVLIETILTICGVAIIAVVIIATIYKAPSCTDNKQDGNETGIDCGGPCPYLCSVDEIAPEVSFVVPVSPQPGRIDVIAYIENKNNNAQVEGARYLVQLYDTNHHMIASKSGTVNLPPSSTSPVFIPELYQGNAPVSDAFLTLDPASLLWVRTSGNPVLPSQSQLEIMNGPMPKITAVLTNPIAYPIYNEKVVATVFNAQNNAIGASQTVVPILPAQGTAPIVFTWNQAFTSQPARVEILPSN